MDQDWYGRESDSRTIIVWLYVVGVVLLVAGGYLAAASWPSETTQTIFEGTADQVDATADTGSLFLAVIGVALAGAGQVMLLVGIIASGVRLGRAT